MEGESMSEETVGEVPEIPEVPKRRRRNLIVIAILVIAIVVATVGIGLYIQTAPEGEEPSPSPIEYETYSKYGFSIEYPKDMTITEEGVVDAEANDNSGQTMGESFGPYKAFAVTWVKSSTPLTRGDLEDALEEIFESDPNLEKTETIVETTKSGHEMIYQRYTYTEDWQKTYGIFGVWYCDIDKKFYCLGNEQTTEHDALQIFEQYLDSFVCH